MNIDEIKLDKTNVSVSKSHFLDMTISVFRGKFFIKLYDKRNDFDFDVINFPFLDGNIPKGQSYGIFIIVSWLGMLGLTVHLVILFQIVRTLFQSLLINASALLPCASVLKHLLINTFMFGVNLVFHCLLIMSFS